jgi:Fe-S cluster assembly protein SufD
MKNLTDNLVELEKRINRDTPASLQAIKKSAMDQFIRQGFPNTRQEAWRFTDVSDIAETAWTSPGHKTEPDAEKILSGLQYYDKAGLRLVFVNGRLDPALSFTNSVPDGAELAPFSQALQAQPEQVLTHLTKYADSENHPFTALNTAFFTEGTFIRIKANTKVEQPIYIYHLTTVDQEVAIHPRNLFLFDANSQATVVETYIGRTDSPYFINPVTEIVVGENAIIDHYKIQWEAPASFHINRTVIQQQANSRYQAHAISFGATLERNDVTAVIDGNNVEAGLDGLYMLQGRQHVDHHTLLSHRQPHSFSRQLYKGILAGESKAVFNGCIHVAQEAQKTDAIQSNKNLLLSDSATINTQPQLEIFADDVRCTHGGTVGQLNEEALFYLQSRGIGQENAKNILVHAFAGEVVDRLKAPLVREQVQTWVLNFMKQDQP